MRWHEMTAARPRNVGAMRSRARRHALAWLASTIAVAAFAAEPAPYRFRAPIVVDRGAPFVELALPPAAYAHAEQDALRDLRVVDARGEPVPFALLPPRSTLHTSEQVREATLYPLPSRPTANGTWPSPVDVVVEGDRIRVQRHGRSAATIDGGARDGASGGWLIDTGEPAAGEPRPRSLRLGWSGPAEFSASFRLETSDDLRSWRSAGGGQLMALQSPAGALTQPVVDLGDNAGRFVRVVWLDPATAPALTGATAVIASSHDVAVDGATELRVAASAGAASASARGDDAAQRRALQFDLGGALPLVDVDLRFAAGTHVAPVRVFGRDRVEQPWRELGRGVFYRLERASEVASSPAITMPATVRFVRVVPDERAAAIDPASVRLVVHASLASLVFATQGEPPFALLAGSADAPAAALPLAVVVPQLESERAKFGRATLGAFTVDAAAADATRAAERQARLRPWLLWAVLLIGAGALAALVWRLARAAPTPPA